MSVAFLPQQKGRSPPNAAQIQKMLDENTQLINCIVDYQNKGKAPECLQYQTILHRNLVYLASLADTNPNIQALLPPPQGFNSQTSSAPPSTTPATLSQPQSHGMSREQQQQQQHASHSQQQMQQQSHSQQQAMPGTCPSPSASQMSETRTTPNHMQPTSQSNETLDDRIATSSASTPQTQTPISQPQPQAPPLQQQQSQLSNSFPQQPMSMPMPGQQAGYGPRSSMPPTTGHGPSASYNMPPPASPSVSQSSYPQQHSQPHSQAQTQQQGYNYPPQQQQPQYNNQHQAYAGPQSSPQTGPSNYPYGYNQGVSHVPPPQSSVPHAPHAPPSTQSGQANPGYPGAGAASNQYSGYQGYPNASGYNSAPQMPPQSAPPPPQAPPQQTWYPPVPPQTANYSSAPPQSYSGYSPAPNAYNSGPQYSQQANYGAYGPHAPPGQASVAPGIPPQHPPQNGSYGGPPVTGGQANVAPNVPPQQRQANYGQQPGHYARPQMSGYGYDQAGGQAYQGGAGYPPQ